MVKISIVPKKKGHFSKSPKKRIWPQGWFIFYRIMTLINLHKENSPWKWKFWQLQFSKQVLCGDWLPKQTISLEEVSTAVLSDYLFSFRALLFKVKVKRNLHTARTLNSLWNKIGKCHIFFSYVTWKA